MLNQIFMNQILNILLQEKQSLINRAQQKQHDSVDMDGDEIDEIQGNMLLEMNNQLQTRNAQKILKIDEALLKINNSTYGICEDCGEDIPEKRLLINPHFLICVSCAEEREMDAKQKMRRL